MKSYYHIQVVCEVVIVVMYVKDGYAFHIKLLAMIGLYLQSMMVFIPLKLLIPLLQQEHILHAHQWMLHHTI
ncbi:hypothetical protein Ccrd_001032 [Cynara cardunculus var. scolymus]|uniref:Uncharacterized protein n=1 Tax=Cynara cardunculus var. scolymus TaxID=59895 RepID=A0A103XU07_CYNCS|nr:hypothetical protein Ccrd_001032 [Cynara cardunculus var. scolymus]